MRIAVMGAGGMGGYFGGLLARAGEDVTFIARGAHLEAMRSHGLTVKSRLAGDFALPVKATGNPAEVGPVDLVLFCVKTYDTEATAERIKPLIGPDTVVLSVQNGIDNVERIGRIVGPGRVMCAAAYVSSVIESPGVVSQTAGQGKIILGESPKGASVNNKRLLRAFQQPGIIAELCSDIRVELWVKFIGVCGFSGVPSLTRLSIGMVLACAETRNFLRGTVEEVEAIARASDVVLAEDCIDRTMALFASLAPGAQGSMAYDLAAGRRLELETLNGTVVRLGRERGIPTPFNFAIYAALKPYADGAPAMPMEVKLP